MIRRVLIAALGVMAARETFNALATEKVKDKFARIGFELDPRGPEGVRGHLRIPLDDRGRLIRCAGIEPE